MRIIAGIARGRKLIAPSGMLTRPTASRVREALFSILQPEFTQKSNLMVLDLFAGSGALGLEALSRGAHVALFVENQAGALAALRRNVASFTTKLVAPENIDIWPVSFMTALKRLAARSLATSSGMFDLVFLDPPYQSGYLLTALTFLSKEQEKILQAGALLVAECATRGMELALFKNVLAAGGRSMVFPGLQILRCKQFGDTALVLLRRAGKEVFT